MNKKQMLFSLALCGLSAGFVACSEETLEGGGGGGGNGGEGGGTADALKRYVVVGAVDDFNYLKTTDSLGGPALSVADGLQAEAGTYWVFMNQDYLFRLVYNNGGAGTGESYILNTAGQLSEKQAYTFNRITTYGTWGTNVITASAGDTDQTDAEGYPAQGLLVNYLSATDGTVQTRTYPAENYLGNGEYVTFAGFVDTGNRLYTSVIPMGMSQYGVKARPDMVSDERLIAKADGGSHSSAYVKGEIPTTQYPDSAFVAIYSGDDFSETPVIARTGRIGFACGRMRSQYYQTIWAAENGDIYVFSPGYGRLTSAADVDAATGDTIVARRQGTLPSGVMRIKAGETDFDPTYYVNLEELGNRHPMYRCWPIGDDQFLLQLYTRGLQSKGQYTTELAVFSGEARTLTVVSGLPEADAISSFGSNPFSENGYIYMPVTTTTEQNPALYRIDPATATAEKVMEVEAESISTLGVLRAQE